MCFNQDSALGACGSSVIEFGASGVKFSFNMELIEISLPRNLDNAFLTVDPHPENLSC